MASAVGLRADYSAAELRRLAASTRNANQSRRLLSLAAVLDGMNRTEAARIGGMDRQTLRDWVHRFNGHGPEGLLDSWSKGPEPRLSHDQRVEMAKLVATGPDQALHGVVRWRRIDLQRVILERFGIAYHERTIGKLLKGCRSRSCWNASCSSERHEVTGSGRECNGLIVERRAEGLPAVDLPHLDLARGKQRPEQHGSGLCRGQDGLGLHPSLELLVQAFDGVGGPRALPLARWQSREGEQLVASLLQAVGNGAVPQPPFAQERLSALLDVLGRRGGDHVGVVGRDFVVEPLGRMG